MGVLSDARTQHRYQSCRDESCQRYACRVYREGYRDGHARGAPEGYAGGRAEGYSEGWSAGYSAGAASCGDG
jgi:flagellar biosynthesis/type III secretory pathway protein FliH